MKVAIPAEGRDLKARVGERLGLSPCLLIINLESGDFEVIRMSRDSGSGSGMHVVARIIAESSDVVLTGWCSPTAESYLSAHGVEVFTGISGTVAEVLDKFKRGDIGRRKEKTEDFAPSPWRIDRGDVAQAVRRASHQITTLLPVVAGVVLLIGLFNAFISRDFLTSFFSGSVWRDSLWGACIGSVFTGNPINSYIIGGELLDMGVSLVAVTAFITSWVTVGIIQLPAESAALGWKFAVLRNLACFGLCMAISFVMILIPGLGR